jgi:hypothetical protein
MSDGNEWSVTLDAMDAIALGGCVVALVGAASVSLGVMLLVLGIGVVAGSLWMAKRKAG